MGDASLCVSIDCQRSAAGRAATAEGSFASAYVCVELIGIEPMTSGLQSQRSPN